MRSWLVMVVCVGISACSEPAVTVPTDTNDSFEPLDSIHDATAVDAVEGPLSWDISKPGPYRVGYRTLAFSYDALGHDAPRDIQLSLWYPTTDTEGDPALYLGLLEDELAILDASLAPSPYGEKYPVHVHSHGHQGFAGSTNFLMRHFASHGWVVAAPDHSGNTLVDNIDPRPPWMYTARPADISASLDFLDALPENDPLKGLLATDTVVMSGHSFGGYTTFVSAGAAFDQAKVQDLCAEPPCSDKIMAAFAQGVHDSRVVAAIPMAAGNRDMFGEDGYQAIACPVLYMTGSVDHPELNEAVWSGLEGTDALRLEVIGGCHQLFGLGACHDISDVEGFAIVQGYALAFARQHILSDTAVTGLLSGVETLSDKAMLLTH